jgi:gliding motility-associated lipoprotein GldH
VERSEYKAVKGAVWDRDNVMRFQFSDLDTIQPHQVFINIRNDDNFAFSNLFLIASITTPQGEVITDTLEYAMALPDGTWLGKGMGSIKENKLWYKENIVFPRSGVYTFEVAHAMRKNGNVVGLEGLEGVTDVGIEISKSNP